MQTLEEAVFWKIYTSQMCLRHDLSDRLAISRPSVSRAVESLLTHQLIVETRPAITKRGRKPHFLQVNPKLATLLGVEIDRNSVTAVVTDMAGVLLGRGSVPCEAQQGVESVVKAGKRAIRKGLGDAGVRFKQVSHVGVGHPGVIDLKNGVCEFWYGVPSWRNVPLKQILERALDLPVTLDDRSRAVALAERRASPEDGKHPNALYVNAGIGVGTAVFIGGHLHHGSAQAGGEIGHLAIDRNGRLCSCGKRGCVQAYAGITELLREIRASLQSGAFSLLRDVCREDFEAISIEMVASAAAQGDRIAAYALREAAEAIGMGIACAVQILGPSLVVLCGRLMWAAGPLLLPSITDTGRHECFEIFLRHLRIRLSTVKKDISAVGCALLGARAVADSILDQALRKKTPDALREIVSH